MKADNSVGPMTLGNMRQNGVRSIAIFCRGRGCYHQSVLNVDHMPEDLEVPSLGRRMRCAACGHLGAETRPNWGSLPSGRR
jgi:hypothetical protein